MIVSEKSIKSLAEGILSYYTYLTKCGVYTSINEYTLYEPIFRMLNKHNDIMISCEYPVNLEASVRGDKKRIDFVIQKLPREGTEKRKSKFKKDPLILYAIELKLLKKAGKHFVKNAFTNDREKLLNLQQKQKDIFGKYIFALYKTNKKQKALNGSSEYLSSVVNCVDATYRLDVIDVS